MNTTVENGTPATTERSVRYVTPDVNVFETPEAYYLEAEMPGVGKEGLEITVEDQEIALVGRRQNETVTGQPVFRERHAADYRRVFRLDPAIDTAKITAKIDQGMVTVTLPKYEKVKPRKISVE
jgi:HSP20 family protein